jgi:hypothetical protein
MPTSQIQQQKQYARVARTFSKALTGVTNARVKTLAIKKI